MQVASTYVRELFAITEAVKKWKQYLLGRRFRIFTGQKSLKHLLSQVVHTPKQYKWASKLIGFDFQIFYKLGKLNVVTDALSRIEEASLLGWSTTNLTWLEDLHNLYKSNIMEQLVKNTVNKSNPDKPFLFRDWLLYQQNRWFVLENA